MESDLDALGVATERINGVDRLETAAGIAREVTELGGPVQQAIVTRADD